MLVGGGMEDGLYAMGSAEQGEALGVAGIAQDGLQFDSKVLGAQLTLDGVKGVLIAFHQQQPGGAEGHDLAAEFAADRSTRPPSPLPPSL